MQDFNFHQHTYRCKHAEKDVQDEEYVIDYIKQGIKKIAFTDHCPEKEKIDKRPYMRMDYEERLNYLKSIRSLKEKYKDKIDIKIGYEIEYLPGQEHNLQELKEETEILILGQHFVYNEDESDLRIIGKDEFTDEDLNKYGNYLFTAMKLGLPNIIAHPDVFMNSRDEFGKIEKEVTRIICETASNYKIPLEINLNNIFYNIFLDRQNKKILNEEIEKQYSKLYKVSYPNKYFWEIASGYDIKVLYGLDTHFKGQIELFETLIKFANEIIGKETIDKLNFIKDIE